MATNMHLQAATRSYNKGANKDRRITQCKVCHLGIYEDQPKLWCPPGYTGFVHEGCLK